MLAGRRAPVELWSKWTSAALKLNDKDLVPVRKQRRLRRFRTDSIEPLELGQADGQERQRGCDAELSLLVDPDGGDWWTFGFEAFGSLAEAEHDLGVTAAAMEKRLPPALPPPAVTGGYPAWLAAQ